jgi:hypothetical protein
VDRYQSQDLREVPQEEQQVGQKKDPREGQQVGSMLELEVVVLRPECLLDSVQA